MFIEYLFVTFPIRKVYTETLAFNASQFESALGSVFTVEGVLQEHEYYDGEYHDLTISSVSRSQWDQLKHDFGRVHPI